MADEPVAEQVKPRKGLPRTALLVGGVAIVEAVAFIAVFMFTGSGGPAPAHGDQNPAIEDPAQSEAVGTAEVVVLKGFRVPNDKSGMMYLYDVDISVVVRQADKELVDRVVKERDAEIRDRVSRVVRSASDQMLREDDLRVFRQQVREALQEVIRDDKVIMRVLIPRLVPIRAG